MQNNASTAQPDDSADPCMCPECRAVADGKPELPICEHLTYAEVKDGETACEDCQATYDAAYAIWHETVE